MFGGAKPWSERVVKPKPCRVCNKEFQPVSGGNVYCPDCGPRVKREKRAAAQRKWRKADPQRHAINKARFDLKAYGMTVEDYFNRLADQGGVCAICGTDDPKGRGKFRKFAVDHCHSTGAVRGLLCHRCNGALGMVGDREEILEKMIAYLRRHHNE